LLIPGFNKYVSDVVLYTRVLAITRFKGHGCTQSAESKTAESKIVFLSQAPAWGCKCSDLSRRTLHMLSHVGTVPAIRRGRSAGGGSLGLPPEAQALLQGAEHDHYLRLLTFLSCAIRAHIPAQTKHTNFILRLFVLNMDFY
jgi:hypothetical protein